MAEKEIRRSCVDCGVGNCNLMDKSYPNFCLSTGMTEEELKSVLEKYTGEELRAFQMAAEVENDNYCQMTRVQEVVEFAKKLGYHKIGIATCVGLLKESGVLARVLRSHGFEVFGVGCKCGTVRKVDMGIDERCNATGVNMCNPILQAELLNKEGTELNIVMGLCVGHDSLFYRHSEALVTTLVAKDRVLGHNTVAALQMADGYYAKKLFGDQE